MTRAPSVTVVVPVFNSERTLAELVKRIAATLDGYARAWEAVLVNDGSTDGSWERIEELADRYEQVVGLDLDRNFGQHNALLAGIRAAKHDVLVTLDDDLQNPPEEIPKLLTRIDAGWQVVYGRPEIKRHGWARSTMSRLVLALLGWFGGRSAPMVSSFRAFRAELREAFESYNGPDVSIDGLLAWSTESFTTVQVEHHDRAVGRSNYSIWRLIKHAVVTITAFSTVPLRIATTLGFLVTGFGLVVLVYVLARLVIEGDSVPGFPFLASVISIFAGAQLFSLGVIGEYVARVHVRVMGRPSYSVRTQIGGGVRRGSTPRASDEGAEVPSARILEWDTEFWGFAVAQVDPTGLVGAGPDRIIRWCRDSEVRCMYLLADSDDPVVADLAEEAGFRYVDSRVLLSWSAESERSDERRSPDGGVEIRPATAAEKEEVVEMATRSYGGTRFFFDPGFPDARARDLYGVWAARGFEAGDRTVYVASVDGKVAGHMVLHEREPGVRVVELIAVASDARRGGLGSTLLDHAKSWEGVSAVEAVTQGRNLRALQMYQNASFKIERSQVWYHLWP